MGLRAKLAQLLGLKDIGSLDSETLIASRLDSLDQVEIVTIADEEYGSILSYDDLEKVETVGDLETLIDKNKSK